MVKSFFSSGEKQLADRIAKVDGETEANEKKLTEHDRRIQAIESEIKHMPDRETTHRIEMTMTTIMGRLDAQDAVLAGRFEALDERLKPIQAIGERLQDVLVEQAKRVA
ncbi:Clp protease [Rhizobium leguminosarum]|uniref:Clp protease n=1 Tax=Rhizobium leguminosarum TaxID=384 RepID=UPI001FEF0B7F|nr:Clp protease [Rhizobium leguminosarum]